MARVQAWFDAQASADPNGAATAPRSTGAPADERPVAAVGSR
jgi:hypothetical protein